MIWPFTRLVHVLSVPVGYLFRPYVVYRSRDAHLGAKAVRRGRKRIVRPFPRRDKADRDKADRR